MAPAVLSGILLHALATAVSGDLPLPLLLLVVGGLPLPRLSIGSLPLPFAGCLPLPLPSAVAAALIGGLSPLPTARATVVARGLPLPLPGRVTCGSTLFLPTASAIAVTSCLPLPLPFFPRHKVSAVAVTNSRPPSPPTGVVAAVIGNRGNRRLTLSAD